MRIRAVVFDLFGTLVPEFPLSVWDGMLNGMASALGADRGAFRHAWTGTVVERQTGGFPDVASNLREIARRIGVEPTDAAIREATAVREEAYRRWFRPQPGAVEMLRWLKDKAYGTAVVSMCAPDAPTLWAASPLDGLIDVRVFSCEVGLRKPDPAIYLAATEGLGVAPAACLYIGDGSYRELTGAAASGMTPVRIVDPAATEAVLRPDVDDWQGREIRSLLEVVGLLEPAGGR